MEEEKEEEEKRLYFLCRFTIMPIVISLSFSELFFLLVECSIATSAIESRGPALREQKAIRE